MYYTYGRPYSGTDHRTQFQSVCNPQKDLDTNGPIRQISTLGSALYSTIPSVVRLL